jgi:hypothetical protein
MMLATACFAAFATDLGHMGSVTGDSFAAFATDLGHVFAILADAFTTFSPDFSHVFAILADDFPALFSGLSRFVRREFVSRALLMGGSTSLAGNGSLLVPLHCRKAALRCRFAFRMRFQVRVGFRRGRLGTHFDRLVCRLGLSFLGEHFFFIVDRKRLFAGVFGVVRVFDSFLALMVNHETPPPATLLETTRQGRFGLTDCCCAD